MNRLLYVVVRYILGEIFRIDRFTKPFLITIRTTETRSSKMDLKVGKQFTLTANVKDKFGNPVIAVLTWTSSDPTVATVESDSAGMFAVVKAVGPLGTVQIAASLGSIVSPAFDVTVVAGDPVSIELSASDPVDQAV